jgi:hypothetical protein
MVIGEVLTAHHIIYFQPEDGSNMLRTRIGVHLQDLEVSQSRGRRVSALDVETYTRFMAFLH